jgi:hypothetical protein
MEVQVPRPSAKQQDPFAVRDDIPIPTSTVGRRTTDGVTAKLRALTPGQSKLFPPEEAEKAQRAAYNLQHNGKFAAYVTQLEGEDGSRRVWCERLL